MLKFTAKNIFFLVLYSIPNTILSFLILYIINNSISGDDKLQIEYTGIIFISIIVCNYLLNMFFQKSLMKYSYNILYENEKNVFSKILNTSLLNFERLGSERFYTVIEDLRTFAILPEIITNTINSILLLILCLIYLIAMSPYAAIVIIIILVGLSSLYFFVMNLMSIKVSVLRKYNEEYYKLVQDVIKGFKELNINSKRRLNMMNKYITPNRDNAKKIEVKVNHVFLSINLLSQYGLYLVIGLIIFLLPEIEILRKEDVLPYIIIILFLSGPVNNLINMQNIYTRFMVANKRILKFLKDFNRENYEFGVQIDSKDFNKMDFKNVVFGHNDESANSSFQLGPLNLKITKGEVIFIVGGNGSGKSTFVNLLTGLYNPQKGEIQLNGTTVESKSQIQNLISSVFTDNHIFSNNYDDFTLKSNHLYQELLRKMKMDKIIMDDKEESARKTLSKGQTKRMSLILALLEKKPILVLDEWAADQDPYFRKYFYEVLIPKLKKEGKTIIAVTHDDRYFKHADRILKFDYGKIVKDNFVSNGTINDSFF
ncbi:MAG: cyclic peptide transporter [Muricauda sp.]|nr:cyclic peptide transporter [Allomuricauda sp.]